MKIFQIIEQNFASLGFSSNQRSFNKKQLQIGLYFILGNVSQYAYLFHDANTAQQYMDSIFTTTTGTLIFISYVNTVRIMPIIFNSIDGLQRVVDESKSLNLKCLLWIQKKNLNFGIEKSNIESNLQ